MTKVFQFLLIFSFMGKLNAETIDTAALRSFYLSVILDSYKGFHNAKLNIQQTYKYTELAERVFNLHLHINREEWNRALHLYSSISNSVRKSISGYGLEAYVLSEGVSVDMCADMAGDLENSDYFRLPSSIIQA